MKLSNADGVLILASALLVSGIAILIFEIGNNAIEITADAQTPVRKEFIYCPPVDSTLNTAQYTDNSRIKFSIEGCPLTRVYVENWDNVKAIDQAKIISELQKNNFRENLLNE